MSWGERSCQHYKVAGCPIPDECSLGTCNVDCRKYKWDQVTVPDSAPGPDPVKIMTVGNVPGMDSITDRLKMAGFECEPATPYDQARAKELRDFGNAAPYTGPNEPCHCGSGRKFKKCCKSRS